MAVEYQFTDRFKWTLIYDETHDATPVLPVLQRYNPIPKIVLPFSLDSNIIAVYCANSQAEGNWRYGGRYFGKMVTNLNVGLEIPDTVIKVGKIYLNQIEIIELPAFSSSFNFEVDVPYWHRNFHLKIWEYDGNNQNTVHSKLDEIIVNTQP